MSSLIIDCVCMYVYVKMSICVYAYARAEHRGRIVYLEGSVFNDEDLTRAGCLRSGCVFVLSDKFTADAKEEDSVAVMHAMAVRDFVKRYSVSM